MDKKYLKLVSYLATPENERKIKSVKNFCEINDISQDEYIKYKNHHDFPDDLFNETKRWHMINRSHILNKFYTQLMSRQNIKHADVQAYIKLIEPDPENKENSQTNNYQFNFLSDLNDEQKENIRNLLKGRGSSSKRIAS